MKRRSFRVRLLRWILCRRGRVLMCQLERAGDRYRVSVLPYGQSKTRFEELFDAGVAAFARHAELVTGLRDRGWTTLGYQ
jgi:hypothetical protein